MKYYIRVFTSIILAFSIIVSGIAPSATAKAEEDKGEGLNAVITANELYLRTGPGTNYDKVMQGGSPVLMKKNQAVKVYMAEGDWLYISLIYNGEYVEGYAFATYIMLTEGIPEVTAPAPEATQAPTAAPTPEPVTDPDMPVFTDPDMPVFTGDSTPAPEAGNSDDGKRILSVSKYAIYEWPAVITANTLNLRKGASTDTEKKATLTKGTAVTVFSSKMNGTDRWYRISCKVDGKKVTGYVLSNYVKMTFAENINGSVLKKNLKILKSTDPSADFLKGSDKKAIKLKKKTKVTIIGEENDVDGQKWFKIKFKYDGKNKTGYVHATDVRFLNLKSAGLAVYRKNGSSGSSGSSGPSETTPVATPTPVSELDTLRAELPSANAKLTGLAIGLAVKSEAKYSSSSVQYASGKPILLFNGHPIEVINGVINDENSWYFIRFRYNGTEYTGYISQKYAELLTKTELLSTDSSTGNTYSTLTFEEKLTNEGFPESYKNSLRMLHEKYPLWQFKAFHTGLEWEDAIKNEMGAGVNLIPNSKSVEWLSFDEKAYNWKTDTFTVYDGSTWVTASKEAIEYYMDPRNFLEENTIFQFETLAYRPESQTVEGVKSIIGNTAMNGVEFDFTDETGTARRISYADAFMMSAEYSGVSPLHLASRVKQEVVIGTQLFSTSVCGTVPGYEGLYNFYNIGAYHSTEVGGAVKNGLKFAKNGPSSKTLADNCLISWTDRYRAIMGGAYYIGYNYINRGQDTIYLQKFNVTGSNTYSHQYMANVEAPWSEGKRVFTGYADPVSLPIEFSIPVYKNMPETACPVPAKAYNPNNRLKSLTVKNAADEKLSLTPSFSQTTEEYTVIVPESTNFVTVGCTTVSKKASAAGAGTYPLAYGINTVTVPVTAENGDVKLYTVTIIREGSGDTQEATPEPTPEPTPVPESTPEPEPTPDPDPDAPVFN